MDDSNSVTGKIILTQNEINQIERYLYDSYYHNYNYDPFILNRTYFNINFKFCITCGINKKFNLYYLYNNRYNILKSFDNVKMLFDDINNFENLFVFYNDEIMIKKQYEDYVYYLHYKDFSDKNANDVKDIIKRLNNT
uniref:Uncharacterized protein n=1 Tax=viral metagenome TaxID=1070528 RepID=A0A6C0H677_9ZZZZ